MLSGADIHREIPSSLVPGPWEMHPVVVMRVLAAHAPRGGISMRLICRAMALTVGILMAALVMVAASACGGGTTTSSPTTNGLEKKSAADVLKAATEALRTAASVHMTGGGPRNRVDLRMTGSSSTGT